MIITALWLLRLGVQLSIKHTLMPSLTIVVTVVCEATCKFGIILCKLTSQNGLTGLDMLLKESPNYVYQLATTNRLY